MLVKGQELVAWTAGHRLSVPVQKNWVGARVSRTNFDGYKTAPAVGRNSQLTTVVAVLSDNATDHKGYLGLAQASERASGQTVTQTFSEDG